jgi:hypothetical protein
MWTGVLQFKTVFIGRNCKYLHTCSKCNVSHPLTACRSWNKLSCVCFSLIVFLFTGSTQLYELLAMLIYKSCVKRSLYCTEFRCSYTQKPKLHVNDSPRRSGIAGFP